MKSYHILIVIPLEQRQKQQLEQIAPGCEVRVRSLSGEGPDGSLGFADLAESPRLTEEDMEWADILFGNVPPAMLEHFSHLQWMQTGSAGVEGYLKLDLWNSGAFLTNSTGAYGLAISEHMLGTLLEIMKKLELYRDAQSTGSWQSQGKVKSIWNSTVLVLGMGDIGSEFGKRCKALGAKVIGVRRTDRPKPDFADEVATLEKLDDLLPQADVVAITLPGTEATKNLFSRERINAMKDGAVLLNVGRGSIVDTEALCDALESGKLFGAGLDVTDPEPLPPEHRLWKIPTAVITPHVSGYYHLKETHERIVTLFAENLKRFIAGEPLRNQIDLSAGYRKLD